jgi:uncharacterized cupredoxin-like copper-binding protein
VARLTIRHLAATACIAVLAAGCGKSVALPAQSGLPQTTSTTPVVADEISVGLTEYAIASDQTSVPAGTYHLAITNDGKIAHELLVFRTDLEPTALPMKDGNLDEEGAGVTNISDGENLDPTKAQKRDVDLTQPGKYLLICNLPGHLHNGMVKALTVT